MLNVQVLSTPKVGLETADRPGLTDESPMSMKRESCKGNIWLATFTPERPVPATKSMVKGYEWVGPNMPVPVSVLRSVTALALALESCPSRPMIETLGRL